MNITFPYFGSSFVDGVYRLNYNARRSFDRSDYNCLEVGERIYINGKAYVVSEIHDLTISEYGCVADAVIDKTQNPPVAVVTLTSDTIIRN